MRESAVAVVLARCSLDPSKPFGIRMQEKSPGAWVATWAFGTNDTLAAREGYERTALVGTFEFDERYPGCPACERPSLAVCECGGVSCLDPARRTITCPWCGERVALSGSAARIDARGDR